MAKEVDTRQAPALWSDDQLRDIKSWDDLAVQLAGRDDVKVYDVTEFGTGFSVLDTKEKMRLIGVKFAILDWRFHDGDQGEFVSLVVMTENGSKHILNDGSTGICAQMRDIDKLTGGPAVIMVPKGLRVSEYTYTDEKTGKESPASTFYLTI